MHCYAVIIDLRQLGLFIGAGPLVVHRHAGAAGRVRPPARGINRYLMEGKPHMRKITFGQRLRYWFDNTMSAGTPALIGWLLILTLAIVAVTSLLVVLVAPTGDDGQAR